MEKLIKSVDEKVWNEFRAESIKHNLKMGEFLSRLINEHKSNENTKNAWKIIESGKASISNKEAQEVKKSISIFDKETDFE